MTETYVEQLERVRGMAAGEPTWDLSDNDTAALRAVLDRLGFLEAALKMIADTPDADCFVSLGMPTTMRGIARKALETAHADR
jgi:hypothetical protein